MSETEHERVESLSDWYLKEQLNFDKRLIRFRYETIKPKLVGPKGLELGPACRRPKRSTCGRGIDKSVHRGGNIPRCA